MEEGDNEDQRSVDEQLRELVDLLTEVQALRQEAVRTVIATHSEIGRLMDELTALRRKIDETKRQVQRDPLVGSTDTERRGFW